MLITCPHCGQENEINPGSILGSLPKTMTPAAIEARRMNATKPRPNARGKRKPKGEVGK